MEEQTIVEMFRSYTIDHTPDGWPAIQQKYLTQAADEIESLEAAYASAFKEIGTLRARIAELEAQLAESRANDRTAMGYLSDIRKIVGGDDFPDMVRRIAELEAGQVPGWISVKDRLPAPGVIVLFFARYIEEEWHEGVGRYLGNEAQMVTEGQFTKGPDSEYMQTFQSLLCENITHWMPLPAAPSPADSGEVKPTDTERIHGIKIVKVKP